MVLLKLRAPTSSPEVLPIFDTGLLPYHISQSNYASNGSRITFRLDATHDQNDCFVKSTSHLDGLLRTTKTPFREQGPTESSRRQGCGLRPCQGVKSLMTPSSPRQSQQHSAAQIPAPCRCVVIRSGIRHCSATIPKASCCFLAALLVLGTGVTDFAMTHPNRRRGTTSPRGPGGYVLANRLVIGCA